MSTTVGAQIGGYRIEAEAGRGGMGVVYRARDAELDRTVALKVIAPELAREEGFRARFVREARVTAQLDHPNVIPVFGTGEDDGRLFIAMRWVEGTDLGRLLRERGRLDPRLAAELVAQAGSALDAAHAHGLVHRDVKPANLLLPSAARSHVYLTDFGLAKRDETGAALTTTGNWMGTPDYAAPEQIEGRLLDGRADVYALGCVLFAALTGRPPFAGVPALRKGWAQVHEQPPTLGSLAPGVPAALEPVLVRALAKDPADRYGSAGELGDAALAAANGDVPRTPRGTARTARLTRPRRRPRRAVAAAALGAAAAAALAAIAVLLLAGGGGNRHAAPPRAAGPQMPAAVFSTTVRCSATACSQSGHRVQPPIEDGRCGSGTWTRIDAGSPPLLACVPATSSPARGPVPMPDVAGARLDRAEHYLDGIGVAHDTSGGGTFGVIVRDNWQVCTTTPPPGSRVEPGARVKLFVDHSC